MSEMSRRKVKLIRQKRLENMRSRHLGVMAICWWLRWVIDVADRDELRARVAELQANIHMLSGRPPCGGSRCHRADDGTWIHSSKSYGTCKEATSGEDG